MKKIFLLLAVGLLFAFANAQRNEVVKKLVQEGIELHDKGDYSDAIKKYDSALTIDKMDFYANYEKSYSCYMAKEYDSCIAISKFILEQFPDNVDKVSVYSNYGSALDDKGDGEEAIKIYNKGIEKYPNQYLLYFNEGLTLDRMNKEEDALAFYQKAIQIKPLHASSQFYTGRILQDNNKVPALLATFLFLAIEPSGERAKKAIERSEQIMFGNIKKDSNNNMTISINSNLLDKKNKKKENDFSGVEMMMSLLFVPTDDKKLEKADMGEKLSLQLQLLTESLKENLKNGKGFYWKFYVPFFIDLKDQDFMSVFSHIVLSAKNDEENNKWLTDNKDKVDEFYLWLKNYHWHV